MRAIAICLAFTIVAAAAYAQQPAPATKTYSSSTDVAALLAKAKSDHKDGQPTVIENILHLAPYSANLEYRTAVGPAAVHEHEAEVFYVLEGSATLVTGGTVTGVAGVALLIVYALARHALDRRRLAGWETAWARTGPRWTTQG